jgi:hypothetical protein
MSDDVRSGRGGALLEQSAGDIRYALFEDLEAGRRRCGRWRSRREGRPTCTWSMWAAATVAVGDR